MVLKDNEYIYLHKFGKNKWMRGLQEGNISFATLGSWIEQAKMTGNIDQGDEHEGVFARLRWGDPRIKEVADYLKDDLQELPDGEYVLLRRKSSHFIPAFCIYGITAGDIAADPSIETEGWQDVRVNYDERLYSGFSGSVSTDVEISDDELPSQFIVEAGEFNTVIYDALLRSGERFCIRKVDYSKFKDDEYYLDPVGDKREELFHKRPYYEYQKELRIWFPDVELPTISSRYPLTTKPFHPIKSQVIPKTTLYCVLKVNIGRREDEE